MVGGPDLPISAKYRVDPELAQEGACSPLLAAWPSLHVAAWLGVLFSSVVEFHQVEDAVVNRRP